MAQNFCFKISVQSIEVWHLLFFFRHYKNLRQGFSLNRPNKFSVFCAKASVQKVALEFPSDTPVQRSPPDGKYIVLELTLMQSAYKSKSSSLSEYVEVGNEKGRGKT